MLLFRARIFGALQVSGEIEKIAKFARRIVLDCQKRAIAKIEDSYSPPTKTSVLRLIGRIPRNRTRHAMSSATAATEFGTPYRDHFNTRLAQQRVRVGVAVVCDHHARL